jgi:hypothetical protein
MEIFFKKNETKALPFLLIKKKMIVRLINGNRDKNQYNKPTHNTANSQGTSDKQEHNIRH